MGIELFRYEGDPQRGPGTRFTFPGSVVHFGTDPPADGVKHRVVVAGSGVAPHHAKLFWSQDSYWLVNLCGLPCAVLKASGRTVYLTVLEPATQIRELEGFQIGNSTFIVHRLERPVQSAPAWEKPADPILAKQLQRESTAITIPDRYTPSHPVVWQTVLRFSTELVGYAKSEEMWRRTLDRLLHGFTLRWQGDKLEPSLLLAAAIPNPAVPGLSRLFFRQSLPSRERVPGEELPFSVATRLPDSLPTTLASLCAGSERPLHFRLPLSGQEGSVHILAGRVFREEAAAGTMALCVGWSAGHEPHFPEHDDVYLFVHLLADLGLNLTLLEQRRQAIIFERLHDLGTATLNAAHDETHLIELITPPSGSLTDLADHVDRNCRSCAPGYEQITRSINRIRAVADQVHGIAKTTVEFAMEYAQGKKRSGPLIASCSDGVRNWLAQLAEIINDDYIDVDYRFADDADPFCADLRFVLAALRNLELNSMRSISRAGRLRGRLHLEVVCRDPGVRGLATPLEYIVLSVADNGEGMDESTAQQLFKGRVVDSASGYGLGTQIIRWVMDQHRGLIRFAAKPGQGAVVELWFPRLRLPDPPAGQRIPWAEQWTSFAKYRDRSGAVLFLQDHSWFNTLTHLSPDDSCAVAIEGCP